MIRERSYLLNAYRSEYFLYLFLLLLLFSHCIWFIKCTNPEGVQYEIPNENVILMHIPENSEGTIVQGQDGGTNESCTNMDNYSLYQINILDDNEDNNSSIKNYEDYDTVVDPYLGISEIDAEFGNLVEPFMESHTDSSINEKTQQKYNKGKKRKNSTNESTKEKKLKIENIQEISGEVHFTSHYSDIQLDEFMDEEVLSNVNDSIISNALSYENFLQNSSFLEKFENTLETFMNSIERFCTSYNIYDELYYLDLSKELTSFRTQMINKKSVIETIKNNEDFEINEFFRMLYSYPTEFSWIENCTCLNEFVDSKEIFEFFLLLLIAADNAKLKEASKAIKDRLMRRRKFIIESSTNDSVLLKHMKLGTAHTLVDIQGGNECARLSYYMLRNFLYSLNENNECYDDKKDTKTLRSISSFIDSLKIMVSDFYLIINKESRKRCISVFKQKIRLLSSYYVDIKNVISNIEEQMNEIQDMICNMDMNDQVFINCMHKEFNKLLLHRLLIPSKNAQEGLKLLEVLSKIQNKLSTFFPITNTDKVLLFEDNMENHVKNVQVNKMFHSIFIFIRLKFVKLMLKLIQEKLRYTLTMMKMELASNKEPFDIIRVQEKMQACKFLIKILENFIKILCNLRSKKVIMVMNKIEKLNQKVDELRSLDVDTFEYRIAQKDKSQVTKVISEIQILYFNLFELLSIK